MIHQLTSFNLGDVEDPHLYAQLHIAKLREQGEITVANVDYTVKPDAAGFGFKVLVYDADEKAKEAQDWAELRDIFEESMRKDQERSEKLWNDLSEEDRLDLFCAVVRRICKAELDDRGTYRYALYTVFGFGPESYIQAQNAGYMALHNSIFTDDAILKLLKNFCRDQNLSFTPEQLSEWNLKHRYY